jgi:hypothetical protein
MKELQEERALEKREVGVLGCLAFPWPPLSIQHPSRLLPAHL